jgi:hypothetical protein
MQKVTKKLIRRSNKQILGSFCCDSAEKLQRHNQDHGVLRNNIIRKWNRLESSQEEDDIEYISIPRDFKFIPHEAKVEKEKLKFK